MEIPIFIIVHDRLEVLKKAVASFQTKIGTPIKLIFHDVASTFPPCLAYLEEMRRAGYEIYRSEQNHHLTVMDTIKDYMRNHPQYKFCVLTDPDIELNNTEPNILTYYVSLSQRFKNKRVIGPMLKIDDIPTYYPYRDKTIASHRRQFWNKKPTIIKFQGKPQRILPAPIDTTFQLFHRSLINSKFPRPGIRTYAPYDARHLDWYIDPRSMTPDQEYYSKNASKKIAHWGVGIKKK